MSPELPTGLPDDSDYWERLAERINLDAAGPLAAYAHVADSASVHADAAGSQPGVAWYRLVARRAPWLVAASAAAALVLWLVLPERDAIAVQWMVRSLSPDDGAGTLVSGTSPPAVNELMVRFADVPEQGEGR